MSSCRLKARQQSPRDVLQKLWRPSPKATVQPLEVRLPAASLQNRWKTSKQRHKPTLRSGLPPPRPPQQLSSASHPAIRDAFISSEGDFFISYISQFLVSLMEDEGKEDSSKGSFKLPMLIPENPGKPPPLCSYPHYPLCRCENLLFKEDCKKIQLVQS